MSVNCTDNSTECLLRALIETVANQHSPWEPRSFGFTVAIGVAAFLISFVAIFQGLLAAGPGRMKASSNAIGAFSNFSRGKLSWIEFAWRSTAYIPFVNVEDLREGLQKQTAIVEHGTNYPFSASRVNTGATWLQLFRSVGLNSQVREIFYDVLQPCATDHLPADIQAPPISIQLQCLAILAAISDPTITLEPADRFISISGTVSLVSFREHPVLGTIGGYERYQNKVPKDHEPFLKPAPHPLDSRHKPLIEKSRKIVRQKLLHEEEHPLETLHWIRTRPRSAPFATLGRCTSLAFDLAQGHLQLAYAKNSSNNEPYTVFFLESREHPISCQMYRWHNMTTHPEAVWKSSVPPARVIALMVAQTDYEARPFPWKRCQFDDVVECLSKLYGWLFESEVMFERYLAPANLQDDHGTAYINRNSAHDVLFEYRGSWIVVDDPKIDIPYQYTPSAWYKLCTLFFKRPLEAKEKARINLEGSDTPIDAWMGPSPTTFYEMKMIDIALRQKSVMARKVLDAFTTMVTDRLAAEQTQVNNMGPNTDTATVDSQRRGSSASSSSSSSSSSSILAALPPGTGDNQIIRDPGTAMTKMQSKPQDSDTHEATEQDQTLSRLMVALKEGNKPEASEEACVMALLGIRATIFACLLRQGTDTSMLFDPDFKDSIVKII